MEKFSLEAAQKGKELITRDGRPARYIATMQQSNPQFPVVVEVFQHTEEEIQQMFEDEDEDGLAPVGAFDRFAKKQHSENANWHMENFSIDGEFLPPFEQPEDLFIKTL